MISLNFNTQHWQPSDAKRSNSDSQDRTVVSDWTQLQRSHFTHSPTGCPLGVNKLMSVPAGRDQLLAEVVEHLWAMVTSSLLLVLPTSDSGHEMKHNLWHQACRMVPLSAKDRTGLAHMPGHQNPICVQTSRHRVVGTQAITDLSDTVSIEVYFNFYATLNLSFKDTHQVTSTHDSLFKKDKKEYCILTEELNQ